MAVKSGGPITGGHPTAKKWGVRTPPQPGSPPLLGIQWLTHTHHKLLNLFSNTEKEHPNDMQHRAKTQPEWKTNFRSISRFTRKSPHV